MRTLRWFGTTVVALFAATTGAAAQPVTMVPAEGVVLERFDAALAAYLHAHRFPEPVDLETLCLPDAAQYAGPRVDEPPAPREGDLFTPDVMALIRTRLAALHLPANAGRYPVHRVAVGDRLAPARGAALPRTVAGVLPLVPADLAYRVAGADLVLLDLRANVVVDAIRGWRR